MIFRRLLVFELFAEKKVNEYKHTKFDDWKRSFNAAYEQNLKHLKLLIIAPFVCAQRNILPADMVVWMQ